MVINSLGDILRFFLLNASKLRKSKKLIILAKYTMKLRNNAYKLLTCEKLLLQNGFFETKYFWNFFFLNQFLVGVQSVKIRKQQN